MLLGCGCCVDLYDPRCGCLDLSKTCIYVCTHVCIWGMLIWAGLMIYDPTCRFMTCRNMLMFVCVSVLFI